MRRVIGIDIHRTFGEVVIWESGVLRHAGRVDMYSATIWMRARIALPELLLLTVSLPHRKCSRGEWIGDDGNEEGEHGDAR